jgi:hypothetical protein
MNELFRNRRPVQYVTVTVSEQNDGTSALEALVQAVLTDQHLTNSLFTVEFGGENEN